MLNRHYAMKPLLLESIRAIGALALAHSHEVKEEFRTLRRRRGRSEEAVAAQDLTDFANLLIELVEDDMIDSESPGGGAVAASDTKRVAIIAGDASSRLQCHSMAYGKSSHHVIPSQPASPAPSPIAVVLGESALLHLVFDMLAEGRAMARRQLSQLALVSRQWREIAQSEHYWGGIALELFPRLSPSAVNEDPEDDEITAALEESSHADSGSSEQPPDYLRRYVLQYGRCLVEQPLRIGAWHEGITLSFDLHDEQDGLRLFSSTGPIRFTGTTIPGITAMKLTGRRRRVSNPFSASNRDRGGHFATIEELIQEGDQAEYPISLTVRVTAKDERTGRMALLFQSDKRSKRWVEPLGVEMGVPEGTLLVNQGWNRVQLPCRDKRGSEVLNCLTVFYLAPCSPEEPGTDPAERLYSVLTLDCAFMLQCKTEDQEAIGRFVLAALDGAM